MESEYLAGYGMLPFSLLEIILFFAALFFLIRTGRRWRLWLGSLLLLYWVALIVGRLWPPPKFDLPATQLSVKTVPGEDPEKANFVWSPEYRVRLWLHIFPARKYALIHDSALKERVLTEDDLIQPAALGDHDLHLVHSRGYLWRLYLLGCTPLGLLNGESPISLSILNKLRVACGGTYLASKIALEQGLGMNLCGGFHHAFACREEGFCHLNDIAVAIRKLQMERAIERAMVIDCDVHQGNGTAAIFEGDDNVFTFSIHQKDLYPYLKQVGDYDISLYSHHQVGDERYLEELKVLPELIKMHSPDLIIYLAGADPFVNDRLGSFLLTKEGMMKRDAYVLGLCFEQKIPAAIVLGGGYAINVDDTVEIHLNTIRVVLQLLKSAGRG